MLRSHTIEGYGLVTYHADDPPAEGDSDEWRLLLRRVGAETLNVRFARPLPTYVLASIVRGIAIATATADVLEREVRVFVKDDSKARLDVWALASLVRDGVENLLDTARGARVPRHAFAILLISSGRPTWAGYYHGFPDDPAPRRPEFPAWTVFTSFP